MDILGTYTRAAVRSSGHIIEAYSTSFGWACRTLPPATRRDIAAIYALVRVADETVDGAAARAGLEPAAVQEELDRLEAETVRAIATGFSTNMVVHSFAATARQHGIGADLTGPFFASMRADVTAEGAAAQDLQTYIYGSAEVVGLMCLRVFSSLPRTDRDRPEVLQEGARRLGAAFQKVNFLRDLGADRDQLGRVYLPGTSPAEFTDEVKREALADIRADLDAAAATLELLDPSARRAVALAYALFCELADRLERTPAATLAHTRVRVPNSRKAVIAARVLTRPARGTVHHD
ncbi:phytoene/squalene synthase family protein [Zhihengliuella flava]|uniref:Phytoene/squalene synthetase n=1 Tax=Zhihengliuella flava TaxID=1285193 RepID=A0A931D9P7_9MICC|nr:phytoene/squalene synthetase [Zhihengliuella flava]